MSNVSNASSGAGIGIGTILAVIMSWTTNHSVGWAAVHGLLGWLYVIARVCGCADGGPG